MGPSQIAGRRAAPRSQERLDRDRQAAPQVFERLRGMIISLGLPPGSALSRAELATQFGVSSTPIRDALMRLEEEGLVDCSRNMRPWSAGSMCDWRSRRISCARRS
jgi:DNA-binding GntR family transcriptional regulator